MGELANLLDSMTIKGKSPDELIEATLSSRTHIKFGMEEEAYEEYELDNLERQLNQLLNRLWAGLRRGQAQALTKVTGKPANADAHLWDARRRRFREEREQLISFGISARGFLCVQAVDLHEWFVKIEDDMFDNLNKSDFLSECSTAISELVADRAGQIIALKEKHYGGSNT